MPLQSSKFTKIRWKHHEYNTPEIAVIKSGVFSSDLTGRGIGWTRTTIKAVAQLCLSISTTMPVEYKSSNTDKSLIIITLLFNEQMEALSKPSPHHRQWAGSF